MHKLKYIKQIILFITLSLISLNINSAENATPKQDNTQTEIKIDFSKILSTGINSKDIPIISNPEFTEPSTITNFSEQEPIMIINIDGVSKGYPLRYLIWHQVINDVIADKPILITYSPLTNISKIFSRKIDDKVLFFKNSGKIYKTNLILEEIKSDRLWLQYSGKTLTNDNDLQLEQIPSRIESFYLFKLHHPDGKIMLPPEPIRHYGMNPYKYYDSLKLSYLYDGDFTRKNINPMDYVVVVKNEAWPLSSVKANRNFRKDNIVMQWISGQHSVLDNPDISHGKDIGNVLVKEITQENNLKNTNYIVTFAYVFDAFNPHGIIHTK